MGDDFRFSINADEFAAHLNQKVEDILARVQAEVEKISVGAHAFIVAKANTELTGYKRTAFLGKDNKNVRWSKIGDSMWVVEVDAQADWIEKGREPTFMGDWLLKSPKAKTAKDGSKYMSIPFPSVRQGKSVSSPVLSSMVKTAMKQEGISMKKIEHNPDGSPKMGVIHKLNIPEPGGRNQFPGLFSAPRSSEMSKITGLPAHGGIFKLQDTVIMQRMNQKGKVVKEAVTFRTISSKHKAEGRWIYPKVEAFNSLQAAHDWAQEQWSEIAKQLESEWKS